MSTSRHPPSRSPRPRRICVIGLLATILILMGAGGVTLALVGRMRALLSHG